jgi:beta-glucosidase
MAALGEIINGSVNPSGKTVDTYVKDLTQTPYYNNIGAFAYNNVDDLKEAIAASDTAYEGTVSFVDYVEGIYVGYKYYETASDDGVINYEDVVKYPFGYGLSYTTFEQKMNDFSDNGDNVTFNVTVTNTGDVAGKDVVEVYFTPPYTNGGIEKASVNLIDYAKTGEIAPGESETVEFTINKEDMASYDANEIKVAGGGYILEAGEYTVKFHWVVCIDHNDYFTEF